MSFRRKSSIIFRLNRSVLLLMFYVFVLNFVGVNVFVVMGLMMLLFLNLMVIGYIKCMSDCFYVGGI